MTQQPAGFDLQPVLQGTQLVLRPLIEADRPGLTEAASDPEIWAGHPARERWRPEVFGPYFTMLLGTRSALAVTEAEGGRIVGTSRFYFTADAPGEPCVGFTFLTRDHWGGGTNFELKCLMFGHAFRQSEVVWLHIDEDNIRSQTAAGRLGAVMTRRAMLDFGSGAAERQCWRVDRAGWQAVLAARGEGG